MSRLRLAIDQIVFARNYTIDLLDQIPTEQWFVFHSRMQRDAI